MMTNTTAAGKYPVITGATISASTGHPLLIQMINHLNGCVQLGRKGGQVYVWGDESMVDLTRMEYFLNMLTVDEREVLCSLDRPAIENLLLSKPYLELVDEFMDRQHGRVLATIEDERREREEA